MNIVRVSEQGASSDGDAGGRGAVGEGAMVTLVPPPDQRTSSVAVDADEQQNAHERRAGVKGSGEDVVVAFPPRFAKAEHEAVEHHARAEPHDVVDR